MPLMPGIWMSVMMQAKRFASPDFRNASAEA
jgi:hypothetical protein